MTQSPRPEPLRLEPLCDMPEVSPGDDLAALLRSSAEASGIALRDGVLVVCQKVVSKAEGRLVELGSVTPSVEAQEIARDHDKDPRHIEVVLRESRRIVRRGHGVLICETHHGFVCANAGVDLSNAPGPDIAILLPEDPDASARRLQRALNPDADTALGVVITDTFGRPWREGLVDMAIGCAGIAPIVDWRGQADRAGRELQVTASATADQLAAAAGILMTKDSGIPAVWVSGMPIAGDGGASELLRDPEGDLFR